jgi:hypothetical protein
MVNKRYHTETGVTRLPLAIRLPSERPPLHPESLTLYPKPSQPHQAGSKLALAYQVPKWYLDGAVRYADG